MCGILGSINITGTPDLLAHIQHRGPDAYGNQDFLVGNYKICFSHCRLSIVDLSEAGKQPMFDSAKSACIIFNGEIYNHEQLKNKLPHVIFHGHSDTETIVNYFSTYGIEESIQNLNGIFSLAYLDIKTHKLYLARDRFGVKPLYYLISNNKIIFSSELRPIVNKFNPVFDKDAIAIGLQLRYIPSPYTLYQNIKKVSPGEILILDLSANVLTPINKYYLNPLHKIGSRKGTYKKLVREYGELFEKAVERQMMSDVDVGVLLSGGVDSALVAAIAKNKSSKKLKAFTVGFQSYYEKIDEIAYAIETAKILNIEHYTAKIDMHGFLKKLQSVVSIVEEPIATTSILPMYDLAALAASKVKVVLSGQGADEPLGGYYKYKALHWLRLLQPIKWLIPPVNYLQKYFTLTENVRRFVGALHANSIASSYIQFNSIFNKGALQKNFMLKAVLPFQKDEISMRAFMQLIQERSPQCHSVKDYFLYHDLRTSLADDLLLYTDKITMNFGLECRVPVLDNDLIAFIESLRANYKFNFFSGKIIHKAFAAAYLPQSIIHRKKLGFQTPMPYWIRNNIDEIEDILLNSYELVKYIKQKNIQVILDKHRKGANFEKQIFLLLSLNFLINQNANEKSQYTGCAY